MTWATRTTGVSKKNISQVDWARALDDCRKIIRACASNSEYELTGPDEKGEPELTNGISFNCSKGCETFKLPAQPKPGFECCKTRQREYDDVVVACLATMVDVLGDNFRVTSDGEGPDWDSGTRLATEILEREIENPIRRTES